ncbi:MAG: hypothetical protein WBL22_04040, partial [Candidatus Sulfotelmatobacter sp.]
ELTEAHGALPAVIVYWLRFHELGCREFPVAVRLGTRCTPIQFTRFPDRSTSRKVLLYVPGTVRPSEFLDHGFDSVGTSHRRGSERCVHPSGINPNRRVLEHVLVPLRLRTLHWQNVELISLSKMNQTGIEIVFPDFLPIMLLLIRR